MAKHPVRIKLIVTDDAGGPFEFRPFCAGYLAGVVDATMEEGHYTNLRISVPKELVPQLDLIAMKHGYMVTKVEPDQEAPYLCDVTMQCQGHKSLDEELKEFNDAKGA